MNNLNVLASATINGGTYDKIKIMGSAKITGDLVAEALSVYGAAKFGGECEIKKIAIYGSANFDALVKVTDLDIKGSCRFNHDVRVENLYIYGAVKFIKDVFRSKVIEVYGSATANTLESDSIKVKGALTCTEQLNADLIEMDANSSSVIKEMVGSKIIVKYEKSLFSKKNAKHHEIEIIEGDEIELENVHAKVVRGKHIKIGSRCKIDRIEYSGTLEVDAKSTVLEQEKI